MESRVAERPTCWRDCGCTVKALKPAPWIRFSQRQFSSQYSYRQVLNGSGGTCDAASSKISFARSTAERPSLKRILLRRLGEIGQADADSLPWWEWLKQEYSGESGLKKTLDELFDRLSKELQLSRDLCTVLGHLMVGRHLRDARAWLLGDPLPESALSTLDLACSPDDDDLEDQAQRVVLDLCRLAGPKIPVVLCFDQIEALLVDPNDLAPFGVLGQVIMKLFNGTSNLLLISCVQSKFVDHLKHDQPGGVSIQAAARMAVHQTSLSPLLWDHAMRLIRARLSADSGLASLRESRAETLWPLDEGELKRVVGARGCTPREILSICAEKFDAATKNREDIRAPVEQFLARTWQERLEESSRSDTSGQVDHILTHGIPLLVHSSARSWKLQGDRPSRDIDLMLEGPDGRLGISLSNHRDLRSLWPRLKRLPALIKDRRVEKLLLLRDVRLPIGKNAVKVNQVLDELCAQGAQFIRPSHEVLAALDALRRLLSDAKAGDLSNQARRSHQRRFKNGLPGTCRRYSKTFLRRLSPIPVSVGRSRQYTFSIASRNCLSNSR